MHGATDHVGGFGGTSISSPIMAGIQALVNQRTGSRWGNPNVNYYRLANGEFGFGGSSAASCNSNTVNKLSNACIFYDVTQGDIRRGVPLLRRDAHQLLPAARHLRSAFHLESGGPACVWHKLRLGFLKRDRIAERL